MAAIMPMAAIVPMAMGVRGDARATPVGVGDGN